MNNSNSYANAIFLSQANLDSKYDHLLLELETSDASTVALALRAIYDGDEHDRFMEKLNGRIKNHDKDIERLCNCHYQGFVDCIHELLKVRPQATSLKNEIIQVNQELLKSSENIQRKADELIKYRRVLCNTKTAIEYLQDFLPMLETFEKLNQQMEEKKYYPALKTLEHFERLYSEKISNYRFTQSICTKVPKIRQIIRQESMKEIKDFLEHIQKLTPKMGEIAMKTAALQQKSKEFSYILNKEKYFYWKEIFMNNLFARDESDDSGEKIVLFRSNQMNGFVNQDQIGDEDDMVVREEGPSAIDLVDFSPVYRCSHIFGCLRIRNYFESYYQVQRKQQARLLLQTFSATSAMSSPGHFFTGDNFRNYLFGVVGFFVIENYLLKNAGELVTKEYLVQNWEDVTKSLVESVHSQASICQDAKQMLYMKSLLMLFCYTMQSYGHSVEPFMKLLVELRQLYTDILLKHWTLIFKKIYDSDNYHPLQINNQQELDEYFSDFFFGEMELFKDDMPMSMCAIEASHKRDSFPRKYPFSSSVPKIYKALREFIVACLDFTNDLNLSNSDKEDTVRKTTNLLLNRTLSDSLFNLIKTPHLGLLQLIQISINTNYLEEASSFLEVFISKLIHSKSSSDLSSENFILQESSTMSPKFSGDASQSHLARLQGRSMFKDARSEAESHIYIQLNKKINEFFSLANYNYLLSDSTGRASSYLLDLIAFLKSTFEAFTNLPLNVAQTACLSVCKYISATLMNILLDEDVKAISHGFLEQFNLDLIQCEMFAGSEPVREFEEGALLSCFAEIRQTLDLFIEFDSWATYFAEYGKNESRYLRVNPQTALILLEKLVRGESKKTIFASLSKNERDKKNKIDTIFKKLKQLINNYNN